jgi:hypothetical protein
VILVAWSRNAGRLGDLRGVSSDEVGVRLGESERHRTGATDFCTGSHQCHTGLGRCEEIEWQRHEGKDRSDAARLLTRGTL